MWERAFHSHGAHLTDRINAFHLRFPNPTDAVAHPRTDAELAAVLDWCASDDVKVVPFGAGSSVVWGVNPPEADAVVTVSMDRFDRVLDVDAASRAARIQAGVYGPALEDQLRPAGIHAAPLPAELPVLDAGGLDRDAVGRPLRDEPHPHRRLRRVGAHAHAARLVGEPSPARARGRARSPDRMVIGSEGILGIITEAWMRIQRRPTFRATAGIVFPSWAAGTDAVRQIVQAKLWPANLRILDPVEAGRAAGLDGTQTLVIVSFESAELSQRHDIGVAVELARAGGGVTPTTRSRSTTARGAPTGRGGSVGAWRDAFIGVDAGTDTSLGLVADTFETAITWDRWPAFDAVRARARVGRAARGLRGHGRAVVPIHPRLPRRAGAVLHVVRDGSAGLRAVAVGGDQGGGAEAVLDAGGTITHHHAVGRMHRPQYDRQRPDLFADALRAAKRAVDPSALLNPGVLIDP